MIRFALGVVAGAPVVRLVSYYGQRVLWYVFTTDLR